MLLNRAIQFSVSGKLEEYERIAQAARDAGITVSKFVVTAALEKIEHQAEPSPASLSTPQPTAE
jgi:uncharacterized protein (DUF1778 family)